MVRVVIALTVIYVFYLICNCNCSYCHICVLIKYVNAYIYFFGIIPLRIETGRYTNTPVDERICILQCMQDSY